MEKIPELGQLPKEWERWYSLNRWIRMQHWYLLEEAMNDGSDIRQIYLTSDGTILKVFKDGHEIEIIPLPMFP